MVESFKCVAAVSGLINIRKLVAATPGLPGLWKIVNIDTDNMVARLDVAEIFPVNKHAEAVGCLQEIKNHAANNGYEIVISIEAVFSSMAERRASWGE